MDRLPNELLLQSFEYLSFNELRGVLGTSVRWRALGSRCRAFWADIQTPASSSFDAPGHQQVVPPEAVLAARRIRSTAGRRFRLELRSAHAVILAALVARIDNVELLTACLDDVTAMEAFISLLCTATAQHLRTLTIELAGSPEQCFVLPNNLFSGASCPQHLNRVRLTNVVLLSRYPLPCFSSVVDLCLSHGVDLFSSVTPDVFGHFPSLRFLTLGAPLMIRESVSFDEKMDILRILETADYSRLTYLALLRGYWQAARDFSWPLETVPHLVSDGVEWSSFPFLPPEILQNGGHLVFDPLCSGLCAVRFGSDDWAFSRAALSGAYPPDPFELDLYEPLADAVRTAAVPTDLWASARHLLDEVPDISELRVIVGADSALPSTAPDLRALSCPNLRALILRGEFDSAAACARIDYVGLLKFVSSAFESVAFPITLLLENVEIRGERPAEFATYFYDVETQDTRAWSYLNARHILNKAWE